MNNFTFNILRELRFFKYMHEISHLKQCDRHRFITSLRAIRNKKA